MLDWMSVALRWLSLFALTLAAAAHERLASPILIVLVIAAAWNSLLTLMAISNRRMPAHGWISVLGDYGIALGLFVSGGILEGNLGWAGVLPLLTACLYFQFRGAALMIGLTLLAQGLLVYLTSSLIPAIVFLGPTFVIYAIVGLVACLLVTRIEPRQLPGVEKAKRRSGSQPDRDGRRTIYELIAAMSESLNYERTLETAVVQSANALLTQDPSAEQLVAAVLLFTQREGKPAELQVGAARNFPASDQRTLLPGQQGLLASAIEESQAQLSNDISQDPELMRIYALQICKSAYCLPLRSGLDTYGVLLFAHPKSDFFGADQRELLDIVGHQATIAIQNARLYQDLLTEKERMMEVQEESRRKIARDLHDGPTQSVAAIAMRINFARRLLERDQQAAADEMYKIEDLARRTTKEIRHMLFTLRPLVLESQGLVAALEAMAEKMRETYNQNVIIQADNRVIEALEPSKQGVVFVIADEAVNNARKHARAPHIWVRLKAIKDDLALLEVEDDGAGFDVKAVDANYESRGSLGMVNMRERTELLNGILHIDSTEGRGTRIQVAIPLTDEAVERLRRNL